MNIFAVQGPQSSSDPKALEFWDQLNSMWLFLRDFWNPACKCKSVSVAHEAGADSLLLVG